MAFKDIDLGAALRRLADRRIEEAMQEGKFDNLPGAGEDLILDDMPADEDVRMTWWCVRLLRKNDYIPEEIRWRKLIDHLKDSLNRLADESRLDALVDQINGLVRKVNTLGTNAMKTGMAPLCLETERAALRARLSAQTTR